MKAWMAAAAIASIAGAARAEVVESGTQGYRIRIVQQVAAPPAQVYRALGEIGRWWSDEHTYSGKAANMTLALEPNGCFCEALPAGGGVRHGVVELVIPEKTVLLDAALGPLQDEGVSGALTFAFAPKAGGTELTVTYNIGGARDFIVKPSAPLVDRVVGEQVARLKRYAETGKPQ